MIETAFKYKTRNYCPNCNSIVETGILFDYTYDVTYTDELQSQGTAVILAKCLSCNSPFLSQENFHNIEDNSWTTNEQQLFPLGDNSALKNAPDVVIRPYKEAQKCYRAQAYEACVIMCRKGIEAICAEKGETRGNLADKLKKLKDKGIWEETFYKWSNELRLIGNDGAHSHDEIIDKQDAKDAIDFFDALITYLYHLVDQYDKLVIRRSK